jgi:hypothetical protein
MRAFKEGESAFIFSVNFIPWYIYNLHVCQSQELPIHFFEDIYMDMICIHVFVESESTCDCVRVCLPFVTSFFYWAYKYALIGR